MKQCPKCGLETNNDGWHVTETPHCRYFYRCVPPPNPRILYSKPSEYDVFPGRYVVRPHSDLDAKAADIMTRILDYMADPKSLSDFQWWKSEKSAEPLTFDELADIGDSMKEKK